MGIYQWPEGSDIVSMHMKRNSTGRVEALISVSQHPGSRIRELPTALRKDGMTAMPATVSGKLALRVSGFTNERRLLDSIAAAGFGTPVNAPAIPNPMSGLAQAAPSPTPPFGHRG